MKLTDEQIKSIISRLKGISSSGITCPVCRNKQWIINNIVLESREFQHGDLILGGKSTIMPFVTITCSRCAHTLFFNAIRLGIVNSEQEQKNNK